MKQKFVSRVWGGWIQWDQPQLRDVIGNLGMRSFVIRYSFFFFSFFPKAKWLTAIIPGSKVCWVWVSLFLRRIMTGALSKGRGEQKWTYWHQKTCTVWLRNLIALSNGDCPTTASWQKPVPGPWRPTWSMPNRCTGCLSSIEIFISGQRPTLPTIIEGKNTLNAYRKPL